MKKKVAIHWFRQDLRLADNPALLQAAQQKIVLPIYILDDENAKEHAMGSASRWWLHYSLEKLNTSLGNTLSIYQGNPQDIIEDITTRFNVQIICWNRCYEPWRRNRDTKIQQYFTAKGIHVRTCNGSLLWEPWQVQKQDGTPYKVFTPFYRNGCLKAQPPRTPVAQPKHVMYVRDKHCLDVTNLTLLPQKHWGSVLEPHWSIGECAAHARCAMFIATGLATYKDGRNMPAKADVSRLSAHIHFGEISPHYVWHSVRNMGNHIHGDHFCSELGWREFSHYLLYYNPNVPHTNIQSIFDYFPWENNIFHLHAWQKGQTGVPMVDAGMRELWQTGYMHNRARMIVGSFLVKNLRLHWHHGERWFWDTLVDADLANNSVSWQWVAGCGADAAPYFRIFNPVIQGKKFDASGYYVRKYIPEIAALPNTYLFSPWEAPLAVLQNAGIQLGKTYPYPIVDLKQSRQKALQAFKALRH